jgi:hypothetical protein
MSEPDATQQRQREVESFERIARQLRKHIERGTPPRSAIEQTANLIRQETAGRKWDPSTLAAQLMVAMYFEVTHPQEKRK